MAALSRKKEKESEYKNQLYRDRFAATGRNSFGIPEAANNNNFFTDNEDEEASANNNRSFPPDSEDGILAQYPLTSPLSNPLDANALAPNNFSYNQQQARMQQGIGAPSYLPDDVADLPDPEFSTEDYEVTYGERLRELQKEVDGAEDIESVQAAKNAFQQKVRSAIDQGAIMMQEKFKEFMQRKGLQFTTNGTNAAGSTGWDGFVTYVLSYLYIMTRGAVSILSPESQAPEDFQTFREGMRYTGTKLLHTFFPPYRPLREPGDFLYFLFLFIMSSLIVCVVIGLLLTIMSIFLFPIIGPGSLISK